jgi:oligopeptide transport system substrate-binding protein
MPRRLWLSAGLLATGAVLLATARLAGATPQSSGIFRAGFVGASVPIDPQVSYITTGWWMEYATAAKLYNWTDRGTKLVPEVASRFAVSNRGRTYTFFLRKGFRFSDGSPVTARNFVYAFDRIANPELQSPAAELITAVKGVRAEGSSKLVIRLTKPDGAFLLKLTMPFFQATSTTLPLTQEVTGGYPSAGPYFFAGNQVNELTSIRRNAFYKRGPGRLRPANVAGVDVHWNLDEREGFRQVMRNQLDEGPLPASEVQTVANQFGVNRSRFWSEPTNCIDWLLFNGQRGILRGNPQMRKAINWAVDRTAFAALAGPYAGSPWTHLLPPGSPGSIGAKKLQPYAPRARIGKARSVAKGHFRSGKITIAYPEQGPIYSAKAAVVRAGLIELGFKPENITLKTFHCGEGGSSCSPAGNWDIVAGGGWCADLPDPRSLLEAFLVNQPPYPLALAAKYRRGLDAASRLVGTARLRAFGKLDLEIMRSAAPVAVMRTYNNRYFFSGLVDPRSLAYSGVFQDWSIPALALK